MMTYAPRASALRGVRTPLRERMRINKNNNIILLRTRGVKKIDATVVGSLVGRCL